MSNLSYPFLIHKGIKPFAHRATLRGMPDNRMSSIELVAKAGDCYIEADVRTTADGIPVLAHDARIPGTQHRVDRLSYEALVANMRRVEPCPKLADVLSVWPNLRMSLDLKDDSSVISVAQLLERMAAVDRVCITSFASEWRIVESRRLLGSRLCTGISAPIGTALRIRGQLTNWSLSDRLHIGSAVIQPPVNVGPVRFTTREFVQYAHSLGLEVHVWTVNERLAMQEMINLGVDGIITDDIRLLLDVLNKR